MDEKNIKDNYNQKINETSNYEGKKADKALENKKKDAFQEIIETLDKVLLQYYEGVRQDIKTIDKAISYTRNMINDIENNSSYNNLGNTKDRLMRDLLNIYKDLVDMKEAYIEGFGIFDLGYYAAELYSRRPSQSLFDFSLDDLKDFDFAKAEMISRERRLIYEEKQKRYRKIIKDKKWRINYYSQDIKNALKSINKEMVSSNIIENLNKYIQELDNIMLNLKYA